MVVQIGENYRDINYQPPNLLLLIKVYNKKRNQIGSVFYLPQNSIIEISSVIGFQ
jgi:hypothetical protein